MITSLRRLCNCKAKLQLLLIWAESDFVIIAVMFDLINMTLYGNQYWLMQVNQAIQYRQDN